MSLTHLLVASITGEARVTLLANNATIQVIHDKAPRVELVTLHNAVSHGRHPETHAMTYTINEKTGDGVCFWDSNPLSCQLYRWNEHSPRPIFTGLTDDQAQRRVHLIAMCTRIREQSAVGSGHEWEIQQNFLDEWEATILHEVAPLLPEDVLAIVGPALAHRDELDKGV